MRDHKIVYFCYIFICTFAALVPAQTQQEPLFALQRGYRTGYSDGYMAGYRDTIDSVARNFTRHKEYTLADRAYSKDYGSLEDYRDGYQQGFEAGYATGFERRQFESSLPTGLQRRGILIGDRNLAAGTTTTTTLTGDAGQITRTTTDAVKADQQTAVAETSTEVPVYQANRNAIILIPRETELVLELDNDLNTEQSREGERFTAKIVAPAEIAGAVVEGRVAKIRQPGRLKRSSELLLSFDRIVIGDNRWSNFSATLIEVMPVKGDNVKLVDDEGTAIGQSSMRGDLIKTGVSAGVGAALGGVVGGPVGVAVGAGVGAAFGVGAVVVERGKHVRLNRNQQIRIRTAYETQIR